jgi:N utilization substance protein B
MGLRRDGREAAVQYLFAHELHQPAGSKSEAESEAFWDLHSAKSGARKFAESLTDGVLSNLEAIDKAIVGASTNFSLERLANVDRNIIRLAVYELMNTPDLPAPVIMNEAIEIAKKFGAPESASFVNGVIDRIARSLRSAPQARPAAPSQPQPQATET